MFCPTTNNNGISCLCAFFLCVVFGVIGRGLKQFIAFSPNAEFSQHAVHQSVNPTMVSFQSSYLNICYYCKSAAIKEQLSICQSFSRCFRVLISIFVTASKHCSTCESGQNYQSVNASLHHADDNTTVTISCSETLGVCTDTT